MKGNLTIDIGNTWVKVAYYLGTKLVATNRFAGGDGQVLDRFISTYKPDTAILCSTASPAVTQDIVRLAKSRCRTVLQLTHETPMPIRLDYRTPETLGRDRIATAVGAWSLVHDAHEDSDVLVIDAGTAITYDLTLADGCFVGGNIAPGVGLRFAALHEHTGRLPQVSPQGEMPLVGYDTSTAIRSGVLLGVLGEVSSYIAALSATHPGLKVFLAGGDGKWIHDNLEGIRADYFEHLAAEGLNRILLYNQANGNC